MLADRVCWSVYVGYSGTHTAMETRTASKDTRGSMTFSSLPVAQQVWTQSPRGRELRNCQEQQSGEWHAGKLTVILEPPLTDQASVADDAHALQLQLCLAESHQLAQVPAPVMDKGLPA